MTHAFFEKPDRLTAGYLITTPLLLLLGIASAMLTVLIAPPTQDAFSVAALLILGTLAVSSLLSALFALSCYYKVHPSTDRWVLIAIFVLIAAVALCTGIVVTVAVYAITLLGTRKTPRITAKMLLVRMGIPTVIVLLLCVLSLVGFVNLLTGDHYYSESTVGKGGFYYSELYGATLTNLIEVDDSHAIGIYSYTVKDEANTKLGFALFATKEANGKTLYCYLDDSGPCYPSPDAISEMDDERYTVSGHDENGFPERQTHSWRTWHRLSDCYAVCMIPASSECLPEEEIEIVHSAEVTLGEVAFRLYVGMGDVE